MLLVVACACTMVSSYMSVCYTIRTSGKRLLRRMFDYTGPPLPVVGPQYAQLLVELDQTPVTLVLCKLGCKMTHRQWGCFVLYVAACSC